LTSEITARHFQPTYQIALPHFRLFSFTLITNTFIVTFIHRMHGSNRQNMKLS